jgi:uncharacterized membrane protein YgcG
MKYSIKQFLYALLLVFSCAHVCAGAREYIELFDSTITVEKSGMLDVRERIIVHAEHDQIKRGIFRELPLVYSDGAGLLKRVSYELVECSLNGATISVFTRYASNGVIFVIGNPDKFVDIGRHEFVVHYRLSNELGFFATHDELYFNVTGNGWRLPMAAVRATVQLPYQGPQDSIKLAAYTGGYGSKSHDAQWRVEHIGDKNSIIFETTQPLGRYEGLSIVVGWPKGYVVAPTLYSTIVRFVSDNRSILILLICLLFSIWFGIFSVLRTRRMAPRGTIFPLFDAPAGYSPGACAYMLNRAYSSRSFAADVLGVAVAGGIAIESIKSLFGGKSYRLTKKENNLDTKTKEHSSKEYSFESYNKIVAGLFVDSDMIELKKGKENKILIQTTESLNAYYDRTYKSLLTANPFGAIAAGVLACAGFVVSYLIDPFLFASLIVYVLLVLLACVVIATGMFNRWYTPEGRAIVDHIEGFKMYLETAESERMKIIGTPPDRTPELYETFLPYAMALDVEKAWTKQFEPVFEAYERMHHTPYYPLWFIGTDLSGFSSGGFASSFVSSIGSSTISSSSFAPGSSSGFGSGGSSGGGGGGGGGGGW